ncbi:MAG: hypothetical protein R6V85_03890 [Polyangia bacterium]
MSLTFSRRQLLGLLGGGAAGLALSPLPYKLLDDVAIWTQGRAFSTPLPRGSIGEHRARCTLCPSSCAVRVLTVGEEPFAVLPSAPEGNGSAAICALGLASHQLRNHPRRIALSVVFRSGRRCKTISPGEVPGELASAARAAAGRGGAGSVAVVDGRPGRIRSASLARFARAVGPEARLLTAPHPCGGLDRLLFSCGEDSGELAYDLDAADRILGFKAPVLEGYLSSDWLAEHLRAPRESRTGLTQIASLPDRTALAADEWLRVRPGGEAAAALGIAHAALLESAAPATGVPRLDPDYLSLVRGFTPERSAAIAGIDAASIRRAARSIAFETTAAIAGVDPLLGAFDRGTEAAIAALNLIGRGRPLVRRRSIAEIARVEEKAAGGRQIEEIDELEDGSLQLAVIDAGHGGTDRLLSRLEPKLDPERGRLLVFATHCPARFPGSGVLAPVASFLERSSDSGRALDGSRARLALSPELFEPRPSAVDAGEVLSRAARLLETNDSDSTGAADEPEIETCAAAILASRRGSVTPSDGAEPRPVGEIDDAGELVDLLRAGGEWHDEKGEPFEPRRLTLTDGARRSLQQAARRAIRAEPVELAVDARSSRLAGARDALPPVLAKLARESSLESEEATALIAPSIALGRGLKNGERCRLVVGDATLELKVRVVPRVREDTVGVCLGLETNTFGDGGGNENAPRRARLVDLLDHGRPPRICRLERAREQR